MPANNLHSTSLIDLTSQLSLQKKKQRKIETTYDKVKRYTDVLMMSNDEAEIDNALLSLIQIDAHLLVFDSHKVESILTEEYDGYDEFQYLVNRLKKRISRLREEDKKKMKSKDNDEKEEGDEETEEEEYDPKYPEIRSSVEMAMLKQGQSKENSLESEEEDDAVCLDYTCMKKELKTEETEDDDEESVEGAEEYDPEYPEIRSSVEMAMDVIQNFRSGSTQDGKIGAKNGEQLIFRNS
ncbi:unnamed protein product [Caenorhabditis brenneri]